MSININALKISLVNLLKISCSTCPDGLGIWVYGKIVTNYGLTER